MFGSDETNEPHFSDQRNGEADSQAEQHRLEQPASAGCVAEDPLYPLVRALNNPLTLLLGAVQCLSETTPLSAARQPLAEIEEQTRELLTLARSLSCLSSRGAAHMLDMSVTNAFQLVAEVCGGYQPVARQLSIGLVLSEAEPVYIGAVDGCLEMVLCQLLANALQSSLPNDQVHVSVSADEDRVRLAITDQGGGIRSEDLSRVMAPFTRLHPHQPGGGHGLFMARAITERHRGQLEVSSEWGKGSTFTVVLPRVETPGHHPVNQGVIRQMVGQFMIPARQAVVDPVADQTAQRPRILVIDDRPEMAVLISRLLSDVGRCLAATDGEEGIAQAMEQPPALVICEAMLSGMSGQQVCAVLRQDERTCDIPIIMLSTLDTPFIRQQSWQQNINHFIAKPFQPAELQLKVRATLQLYSRRCRTTVGSVPAEHDQHGARNLVEHRFLQRFNQFIGQQYPQPGLLRADLARQMAMSESQLQRKIKAITGQGAMELLREYRLQRATEKLKQGLQVGVVSDACGFNHVSYFSSCFRQRFGVTPKKYQQLH